MRGKLAVDEIKKAMFIVMKAGSPSFSRVKLVSKLSVDDPKVRYPVMATVRKMVNTIIKAVLVTFLMRLSVGFSRDLYTGKKLNWKVKARKTEVTQARALRGLSMFGRMFMLLAFVP
eukprot:CAMPEP_0114577702 /NCGR_PEP_ID=MMETSP0125-20121206/2340_1 /TAXON_ID=485358 ORGANISM="Aristerostoma sp., Strain ATCC 50986" /NCGR_SAMPLE_ID=MMETSP0125 /ASSEMBLY_ACC=CAM_ASM_000245 /LENGTH=116 /DNA_ID=CAMNT_0001767233 /DNA_START=494 /DNA_END=844 /DNA_ORIENTATION=+